MFLLRKRWAESEILQKCTSFILPPPKGGGRIAAKGRSHQGTSYIIATPSSLPGSRAGGEERERENKWSRCPCMVTEEGGGTDLTRRKGGMGGGENAKKKRGRGGEMEAGGNIISSYSHSTILLLLSSSSLSHFWHAVAPPVRDKHPLLLFPRTNLTLLTNTHSVSHNQPHMLLHSTGATDLWGPVTS